jgi:hypothetical protein
MIYKTPLAVLKAAHKKLGGRVVGIEDNSDTGRPLSYGLALTITNLSDRVDEDILNPRQAAKQAGLNYQPGHGGYRKGAGRKRSPETHQRINVYLSESDLARLRAIDESPSKAIRKLLESK